MFAAGLFYSKLNYCLPLFCNTWGLEKYKDKGTRFTCFTKEVLQNKVVRLTVPGSGYNREKKKFNMSTEELYNKSGELSVHQLGAYHT